MNNLRRKYNQFCFRNRDKGIPNLMLYICVGSAIVFLMSGITRSTTLYDLLCFNRSLILRGQVWRLFTYAITFNNGNIFYTAIGLLCYFSLGRAIEAQWGTLRFNLFYFTGILLMDVYCLIFPCNANVFYLHMSLLLAYATLYPDTRFLVFFVIPVRAWIFALIDLGITLYNVIILSVPVFYFPYNLFPLVAIANYFLFFGKDVMNLIPSQYRRRRTANPGRQTQNPRARVIPFSTAQQTPTAPPRAAYLHRCTICGRTDVSHPNLEFRYCSRCSGYHCYCQDHISNHIHIQ